MKTYPLTFSSQNFTFNSSSLELFIYKRGVNINTEERKKKSKSLGLIYQQCPLVVVRMYRKSWMSVESHVPELCCPARMPWHLPDTIVSGYFKKWQQWEPDWHGMWEWWCGRRKYGLQQLNSALLGHIFSSVSQENECMHKLSQVHYKTTKGYATLGETAFGIWHPQAHSTIRFMNVDLTSHLWAINSYSRVNAICFCQFFVLCSSDVSSESHDPAHFI